MPKTQTILTVFVGSPSDVKDERIWLEEIVEELNRTWAGTMKIRLELVKWEKNSFPLPRPSAQATINETVGSDFDIFIGIFWGRFGTPTEYADSGTEEEFLLAKRLLDEGKLLSIGIYFKEAPIAPSKIDPVQIEKIQNFRRKIEELGLLHYSFENKEEFDQNLRFHLSKLVQEYESKTLTLPPSQANPNADEIAGPSTSAIVEESGLVDLLEKVYSAFNGLSAVAIDIVASTEKITKHLNESASMIGQIDGSVPANISRVSHIVSVLTYHLSEYNSEMDASTAKFRSEFRQGMEAYEQAIAIASRDFSTAIDRDQLLEQSLELVRTFMTLRSKIAQFVVAINSAPSIKADFNKTKKKTVDILTLLTRELQNGISICNSISANLSS